MLFERLSEPLLVRHLWLRRLARFTGIAGVIIAGALGLGILGYHYLAGLGWLERP
jgi:hypothetical protein